MNEAEFKSPLSGEQLRFYQLLAREELGRLPEFRIELLRDSQLKPLKADKLLGKASSVTINTQKGGKRYFHGRITQFERGGMHGNYDLYRVVLRPWLWTLTLRADCRIFQDKTVVEILDTIFGENEFAGPVDKKLKGSFRSRPYTVQYRESDFNFVSRLMEEEGIYYYFKHDDSQHTLVLCNGPSGHEPVPVDKLSWAAAVKADDYREDLIVDWTQAHLLQSLAYASTDYAAEAPTASLLRTAQRQAPYPKPNSLEVFDYPGRQDDYAMADNLSAKQKAAEGHAQLEVDRFESLHCVATGLTPYRLLSVGRTFTLADHPDAGSFLVTSSITEMVYGGYEGGQRIGSGSTNYSCRFNAVPKSIAFQPQALTRRPTIRGPQTALVVGPGGDEIHTDKYGRVKVQFYWDRVGKKDEKSSCWVRVAHPWAGKGFGMVALPRIGDEVVIEFLEGNPDRPMVIGRVYNGSNEHPYELPAHATISGVRTHSSKGGGADNFNELRFEDNKGNEYVWFQAEKDYHQFVKNDAFSSIRNDLWTDVTKSSQHKIGENLTLDVGKVTTVHLTGDTHTTLGADLNSAIQGAMGLKVTGSIAVKGEQSIAVSSGASLDIKSGASANLTATAALNQKALNVTIEGSVQLCIKAGSSFITLDASGVTIQGPMVKINSGGAGGSAQEAADASPASPKTPGDQKENKDPLAGDGGGS